ncbi:MAG: hypothetical protein E6J69_17040 [Deltaproteobacteria bacterium]|nr:MAG: hypothetical protein E6J69_17040 [Deltaproteobacteria bacterium]
MLAASAVARASERALEASALCREADGADGAAKRAVLQRGLAAAEAAVRDDETDAAAHFAVFCNLGKLMRLDGVSVASFVSLGRLRREIDRTRSRRRSTRVAASARCPSTPLRATCRTRLPCPARSDTGCDR